MNHPFEIPQYVYKSAERVTEYFARQNITDWAFGNIRSRYGKLFVAVVVSVDLSSPEVKIFETLHEATEWGREIAEEELDRKLTKEEADEFWAYAPDISFYVLEREIE